MKYVVVEVTQEDLDRGLTKSYTLDSAARAIERAIKRTFNITRRVYIFIPCLDYGFIDGRMFETPPTLQHLIHNSDNKRPVKPCTFTLEMPEDFFDEKPGREPQRT